MFSNADIYQKWIKNLIIRVLNTPLFEFFILHLFAKILRHPKKRRNEYLTIKSFFGRNQEVNYFKNH